jgi:hypothetical protein
MNAETLYDVMYRSEPSPLSDYESFFDSKEEFEEWFFEEFNKNYDDSYVNLPIVEVCDYKGEGCGIHLFETVKHLPIFRSKPELSSYPTG